MAILRGRTTHHHDEAVAVFLIGMRVNRWWRVDQWLPTFLAMPRMLAELERNKAAAARGEAEHLGYLGARTLFSASGPTLVQYWRSAADIYRYAGSPAQLHRPAWTAFNSRARRAAGAVGVWHETYAVPAGAHESVYVGMPPAGLARATGGPVPVTLQNRRQAALRQG